jgi:hypothetical protein
VAGVDAAHLGELHQPLGLHHRVGADVEEDRGRRAHHRDRRGDGGTADALDAAHPQQRRGHRGAGVAGRDHPRRRAVAHRLGSAHQRRVLLAADPAGGVLVHRDDLVRRDQREVADVDARREVIGTDEDDGDARRGGLLGALDDLPRGAVATHGVDRDRQHRTRPGSKVRR